jgi:uncharacterized membrane protein
MRTAKDGAQKALGPRRLTTWHIPWRISLWLVPGVIVFAALGLFLCTQLVDRAAYVGRIVLPHWLNQGGPSDARALVAAAAGAIVTTLGLVMSITVLTLSIAANTFGQRMLRRYIGDGGTKICIGTFSATFIFSLLTLLSVSDRPNQRPFVPWASAWTSLMLAVICVIALVYYINHVGTLVQVSTVLSEIRSDLSRVLRQRQGAVDRLHPASSAWVGEESDFNLLASSSGYLQGVRYSSLLRATEETDTVIQFLRRPGNWVLRGSVVACGKQNGSRHARPDLQEQLQREFNAAVVLGPRRAMWQDPEFAIAQIVEIGIRAMSPGVNDVFAALSCVDALASGLREVLCIPSQCLSHVDSKGRVRVIEQNSSFEHMAATGFDAMRTVARNSVALTVRLLESITALAPFLRSSGERIELAAQAELIREGFSFHAVHHDRYEVEAAYVAALHALHSSISRSEVA